MREQALAADTSADELQLSLNGTPVEPGANNEEESSNTDSPKVEPKSKDEDSSEGESWSTLKKVCVGVGATTVVSFRDLVGILCRRVIRSVRGLRYTGRSCSVGAVL